MKSTSTRYGTVAIALHWITALAILVLFLSGMRSEGSATAADKIGVLRVHAPLGISILVLTLLRILWWRMADTKPALIGGMPRWQEISSHAVHGLLYLAMLGMAGSGMALFLSSGAGDVVLWGGAGPLPDFDDYMLRTVHGAGAKLTLALIVVHAGAALWHQFGMKDGLLGRMWFGRGAA